MAATTVLNYLPRKSPVHALTGATKLAFFLLITFASMVTYETRLTTFSSTISIPTRAARSMGRGMCSCTSRAAMT